MIWIIHISDCHSNVNVKYGNMIISLYVFAPGLAAMMVKAHVPTWGARVRLPESGVWSARYNVRREKGQHTLYANLFDLCMGGESVQTIGLGYLWFKMLLNTAQLHSQVCQFPNSPGRNRQRKEEPKSKSTKPSARCPSLYNTYRKYWIVYSTGRLLLLRTFY